MRRLCVLALAALLLVCTACARAPSVSAFQENASALSLPAGVWYEGGACEWEKEYLPDAIAEVFFEKRPAYPWVLYLGTDDETLCEILYAELPSEYEAIALAERLSARLALLRRLSGDAFGESLADASVIRRGLCVLYTVSPLNESVLALMK